MVALDPRTQKDRRRQGGVSWGRDRQLEGGGVRKGSQNLRTFPDAEISVKGDFNDAKTH